MADVKELISSRISLLENFMETCNGEIYDISQEIIAVFKSGNKLLVCGNGGSAADSQHLAAEFMGSLYGRMNRSALPVIALTVDTSALTAISNDFGFNHVFSRQVNGLGVVGDALIIISTSGESVNCLEALKESRKKGLKVLALTRKDSTLFHLADKAVGVPSDVTQYIQECHVISYHIIAELVEATYT